jgi:hypothetical protein
MFGRIVANPPFSLAMPTGHIARHEHQQKTIRIRGSPQPAFDSGEPVDIFDPMKIGSSFAKEVEAESKKSPQRKRSQRKNRRSLPAARRWAAPTIRRSAPPPD